MAAPGTHVELDYTVEWINPKGIATLCWESASEDDALSFAEECAERDRENRHEGSEYRVFCGLAYIYVVRHEGGVVLCG